MADKLAVQFANHAGRFDANNTARLAVEQFLQIYLPVNRPGTRLVGEVERIQHLASNRRFYLLQILDQIGNRQPVQPVRHQQRAQHRERRAVNLLGVQNLAVVDAAERHLDPFRPAVPVDVELGVPLGHLDQPARPVPAVAAGILQRRWVEPMAALAPLVILVRRRQIVHQSRIVSRLDQVALRDAPPVSLPRIAVAFDRGQK